MRRVLLLVPVLLFAVLTGVANAGTPADRWALLIGVDHFEGRTRPNYGAVNDAQDLRTALLRAGWADDHIKVLTDEKARAGDIRAGMRWLVERTNDRSLSVFSYSGHVKQVGSTESLWPYDNRFIADTEVSSTLRELKGRSWINISGCEAAGFDEGLSGPSRLFTASSRSNEKSYELIEARNSVFSLLLVKQGMLESQADANRDNRVSVQEAFAFAAERAPDLTRNAVNGPQHPVISGGDGSDFYLDPVEATTSKPNPGQCNGVSILGIFCVPKLL